MFFQNGMMVLIFAILVGYVMMIQTPMEGLVLPAPLSCDTSHKFHECFDVKQPIIDQLEVSSKRKQSEVATDPWTGYPKLNEYDMDDPFEEVKTLIGHGYAGYDYKLSDVTNEMPIAFPSKRALDMVGGPYFIPPPICDPSGEPSPVDQENMNSRDYSEIGYNMEKHIHPCADVRFDVRDN